MGNSGLNKLVPVKLHIISYSSVVSCCTAVSGISDVSGCSNDLSAAFDTIDHIIMLTRLRDRFGITATCLAWFESYLVKRNQRIQMHGRISAERPVVFGVPQGSVLGPLVFICYTAPLGDIARRHGINVHLYADDTQLYLAFSPHSDEDTIQAVTRIQDCVAELQDLMNINKLKFNVTKTEIIVKCAPHIKTAHRTW